MSTANTDGTETELVKAILEALAAHGIWAWRNNTGGLKREKDDGSTAYVPFNQPGAPDILGVVPINGKLLAIEVKRPGWKPTTAQWEWLLKAQQDGAVAFWTDDLVGHVLRWLPKIKAGYWVETDTEHNQWITDGRTETTLRPPQAPVTNRKAKT